MTIAFGNSAPTPQRPSDCASSMLIDTYFPTVTFTRSGSFTLKGEAFAMIVAPASSDHLDSWSSVRDESTVQV
jgi:hypothetical protein